jgi:hypothetical protein
MILSLMKKLIWNGQGNYFPKKALISTIEFLTSITIFMYSNTLLVFQLQFIWQIELEMEEKRREMII